MLHNFSIKDSLKDNRSEQSSYTRKLVTFQKCLLCEELGQLLNYLGNFYILIFRY
jgi:hypothetical protein